MGATVLLGKLSVFRNVLATDTIGKNPTIFATTNIVGAVKLGESPLVRSHDLLSSRELKLGTTKRLNNVFSVVVLGADGHNHLTDGDTGSHLHGLSVGSTHTRRQTIRTCA